MLPNAPEPTAVFCSPLNDPPLRALFPIAVLLLALELDARAPIPNAVFEDTEPPPRPTVSEFIIESIVEVSLFVVMLPVISRVPDILALPFTSRVEVGLEVPMPRRLFVLSQEKFELFWEKTPLEINGIEPLVNDPAPVPPREIGSRPFQIIEWISLFEDICTLLSSWKDWFCPVCPSSDCITAPASAGEARKASKIRSRVDEIWSLVFLTD